jgi:hypothetical protein
MVSAVRSLLRLRLRGEAPHKNTQHLLTSRCTVKHRIHDHGLGETERQERRVQASGQLVPRHHLQGARRQVPRREGAVPPLCQLCLSLGMFSLTFFLLSFSLAPISTGPD